MQAGLMYGQIGQTESIIRKVKKEESGLANLKVVATGGWDVPSQTRPTALISMTVL